MLLGRVARETLPVAGRANPGTLGDGNSRRRPRFIDETVAVDPRGLSQLGERRLGTDDVPGGANLTVINDLEHADSEGAVEQDRGR